MTRGSHRAAPWLALAVLVILLAPIARPVSASSPPEGRDVVLSDVGPEWTLVDEQEGTLGAFTRTWRGPLGELSLHGFPVSTPPGVAALFEGLTTTDAGVDVIPEPGLAIGAWLVPPGGSPGDIGFTGLTFASHAHLFTITLALADGVEFDGPGFALDLAHRQIDRAGGPPEPDTAPDPRDVDDAALFPLLPDRPPPGYGLSPSPMSLAGRDELPLVDGAVPEVVEFFNDRTKNAARVWAGESLTVGIGISEYPYGIFAAAALGEYEAEAVGSFPIDAGRADALRDAVTFRDLANGSVGVAFRRGSYQVLVLTQHSPPESEATAIALALDTSEMLAARLPDGSTEPYQFPEPLSRIVGLALTALIVIVAVAGSRVVASVRARRVRRRWAALEPPTPLPPPDAAPVEVVDLDADADALRRRGRWVAATQLLTVVVGVVALAGDFGTVGMVVAGASLVVGLGSSRWWMQRELSLLGPAAPPRAFSRPRPLGVLVGLVTFAVLGVGVSFFLKGVRYLILDPTLAQLRWSDLLGLSPRAVGIAFTLGGLAVTFVGAGLYRLTRALSRAGARHVLVADPRPPALYLRSFADDSLPLPTIASARRPLFELFSLRGADPFEESVAWELNSYAPVVAVGRPGGTLRSLGAAREHLAQESWRDEIADRMRDALVIVIAPGETDGVAWELGAIVHDGHLAKTLFVFPPLSPVDLARRWRHTVDLLRNAGAQVGWLTVPVGGVHTVQVRADGTLRATVATTRDEATYRTAVDRSVEPDPTVTVAAMELQPVPAEAR
jgi:hypothetical protein